MSSEFETIQNLLKMLGFRRIWIDLTWCWRLPPKTKTKKWQLFKNGTKNRPIFLLGKNLKNLEVPYSKGRPSLIYSCQSKSRAEWLKPWGVFRDHFQNPWGPNLEGEQKQSYQLPGLPPPLHTQNVKIQNYHQNWFTFLKVIPNRHFRRQKKHCLKAERCTFHPSKECGIAIGFPHETNQLGSFVLAKRSRFWRILKVDQQKTQQ